MPAVTHRGEWPRVALAVVSSLVAGAVLVARLPWLTIRRFDPDELEHVHFAWSILQGSVPYRDFFEHHTPLFHYLGAAFLKLFDTGTAEGAFGALYAARTVSWSVSLAIVAATSVLAYRLRDATTAWVAMPIGAGSIVLAVRGIEIRPDGLSVLFWLLAVGLLHAGLVRSDAASTRTRVLFASSGLAIGVGVLTSQKLLLAGPFFVAILAWYVGSARFGGRTIDRLRNAFWQGAGVLMPWVATAVLFASVGALGDFVHLNLTENLSWQPEVSAVTTLRFVMRYEPWLLALAAGGALVMARESSRSPARAVPTVVLLGSTATLFVGLFLMPVPYVQYCLTFSPFLAILAATLLVEAARGLADRRPVTAGALAIALPVAALALVGHAQARPVFAHSMTYPALLALAGACLVLFAWRRRPEIGLALLVLLLGTVPLQWARWMRELGDEEQSAALRFVFDQTDPTAVVLDGWTGYGVFRRHASYYWMLHRGVRAMLTAEQVQDIVAGVTSDESMPDVVVLDDNLRALSPQLVDFVETRYRPVGIGDLYVRAENHRDRSGSLGVRRPSSVVRR